MGCSQAGFEISKYLKLDMSHCLKQLCLTLVIYAFASQTVYAVETVAIVKGYSSSFEAYKKAQKLHDLQLMAKWGTAKERQHSREALHKIQLQVAKQQQRQQQRALKQQQPTALLAAGNTAKAKKSSPHHPTKADKLMLVNINKATPEQLTAALLGIGAVKAKAIVDYRQAKGAFKTLEDVLAVKGIGPATIAKNRDRIRFE